MEIGAFSVTINLLLFILFILFTIAFCSWFSFSGDFYAVLPGDFLDLSGDFFRVFGSISAIKVADSYKELDGLTGHTEDIEDKENYNDGSIQSIDLTDPFCPVREECPKFFAS